MKQSEARSIIGIIGNVISFGLFLSPTPTFINIVKNKSVQQFSPVPYLATALNCALWILYGMPFVHPDSTLVITINAIGLAFEAVYLSIFFIYSASEGRIKIAKILLLELVVFVAFTVGVLLGAHTHEKRTLIVGILCIIINIFMYASPLIVMKMVIKTKSVKYMPFFLSFASFLNGVCWTAYACLPVDVNILIPNGLGTMFGLAQLILYACFFRSTPVEDPMSNGELELPSSVV